MDGEDHLAVLVVGAGVLVAADAEGVIQQAGGHADLPVWSPLMQLQVESACSPFQRPALPRRKPLKKPETWLHAIELEIEPLAERGASLASSSGFRSSSPGPGRVIPRSSPVFLL